MITLSVLIFAQKNRTKQEEIIILLLLLWKEVDICTSILSSHHSQAHRKAKPSNDRLLNWS